MKVCIDAGHGGRWKGAAGILPTGTRVYEKEITFWFAEVLRLQADGWEPVTTRDGDDCFNDVDLRADLAARAAMADDCDLLISLHANASPKPQRRGMVIFVETVSGQDGGDQERPAVDPALAMTDMEPDGYILAQELTLALAPVYTAHNLSCELPIIRPDSATFAGGLTLLRKSRVPACLIEIAYLTNPEDLAALMDNSFREKWAAAVAGVLAARAHLEPDFSGLRY